MCRETICSGALLFLRCLGRRLVSRLRLGAGRALGFLALDERFFVVGQFGLLANGPGIPEGRLAIELDAIAKVRDHNWSGVPGFLFRRRTGLVFPLRYAEWRFPVHPGFTLGIGVAIKIRLDFFGAFLDCEQRRRGRTGHGPRLGYGRRLVSDSPLST